MFYGWGSDGDLCESQKHKDSVKRPSNSPKFHPSPVAATRAKILITITRTPVEKGLRRLADVLYREQGWLWDEMDGEGEVTK